MPSSYWRSRARPIIAQVLKETQGQDEKAVAKALQEAYPFGPRRYHPYKIWRSEVRRQLGLERAGAKKIPPPDPNQMRLFEDDEEFVPGV